MKKTILLLLSFMVFHAVYSQTFTEVEGISIPPVYNGSVAWGDYNNDGFPDILIAGYGNDEYLIVKIFRNNGDNTFTDQTDIFSPEIPLAYYLTSCTALWVDFDNDDYLDILLNSPSEDGGNQLVIYRNEKNNSFSQKLILNYLTFENNSINCGDYNNDGKQDFMLVNNVNSKIFRNMGNFNFIEQKDIELPGAFNCTSSFFDYDNDGILDVILTGVFQEYNAEMKFYLNQGNNVFSHQTGISVDGMRQGSMEWGDFDHDGYPDLLTAGSGIARIHRNNGDNTFTYFPVLAFQGSSAYAGKWGDMDNDGDLDIVLTGNSTGGFVTKVFINNGDNSFTEFPEIIPHGGMYSDLDLGDYDNDGDLDILLSGYNNNTGARFCKVYRNNATESNPLPVAPEGLITVVSGSDMILKWNPVKTDNTPATALSYNIMIGTIPGGVDVVSPNASPDGYRRVSEMGNGQLDTTFIIRNFKKGNYYWKVQVVDNSFAGGPFSTQSEFTYSYDYQAFGLVAPSPGGTEANLRWSRGNGDNCIVFMKEGSSGYAQPDNNNSYAASSVFKSGQEISSSGWYCIYKGSADSVFVKGLTPGTQYIFQVMEYDGTPGSEQYNLQTTGNNPAVFQTGYFTELKSADLQPVSVSSLRIVQGTESIWFDFDNDDDLDILLTGHLRPTRLYRNDGSGIFTLMTTSLPVNGIQASACGDYNNDRFIDILINEGSNGNSAIYKNNGNGTFSRQNEIAIPGTYYGSVKFGDYDNDGDLDILLTGEIQGQGSKTAIYRNNGNNTFTEQTTLDFPEVKYGAAIFGDYDNDGFPDILLYGITNDQQTITRILRNNRKNSFIESGIVLPGVSSGDITWGDYDNDGDLDILMIASSGNKLFRNDGNDKFTEQKQILIGASLMYGSAAWGDYNNDGYSDFIVTGFKGNYLPVTSLYMNNKNNTFTEDTINHLIPAGWTSTTWGDFDSDGDIDIIITGNSAEVPFSKIFRNEIPFANTVPSPPSNPVSIVSKSDVELKWNSVRSDSTQYKAMTYNVRVGSVSEGIDIVSPHSSESGFRRIAEMGNAQLDTSFILKKLPFGTYYWSVQAVDNGFAGGTFSTESTFSIIPVQAAGLTARILNKNSLLLKWERGNGDRCIVFCKDTSAGNAVPLNNKSYIPDNEFGFGEQVGTSGWYCIYNGRGDSVEVTGLVYMKEYSFHVVEYNGVPGGESYFTEIVPGNPGVFSTGLFAEQVGIPLQWSYENPVVWGDYDNDGYSDILLPGIPSRIYKNQGDNTFTNLMGISLQSVIYGSSAWGDYDNDGDLDILLTGAATTFYPLSNPFSAIYRNEGNDIFELQSSISLQGVHSSSVAWGDYDNDGYIDILLTGATGEDPNYDPVSKIYKNNGDGTFSLQDQIELPGVYKGAVAWVDYDQDGYLDILLSGATGYQYYYDNILKIYRNNGNNSFTEQTHLHFYGAYEPSVDWGDFDNDGYPDLLFTRPGSLWVYKNNEGKSLTEHFYWGWGYNHRGHAVWGDYDNDGLLDILFTNFGPASLIIKNTDGNNFVQISEKSFELVYITYMNWCDYDNDGDIDFLVSQFSGVSKIYKNNRIMKSGVFPANLKPAVPEGLNAQYTPEGVKLSWFPVQNDETSAKAMSYNLRYRSEDEKLWKGAPHSDDIGSRQIVSIGNISLNTSYTYSSLPSGKYYWQVQAIDQGFLGSAWSALDSFVVRNIQAFFQADTVCQGLPTNFDDQSVAGDGLASWHWDFSDGSSSDLQNPEYTFSTSGSFQVKLVITSTEGDKDSLTQEVIVKPKPLVDFTASIACQGSETTLTNLTDAQGLTITSWSWDYGDGKGSILQNPGSHGYLSAGDYQMTLYASANNGCQGSIQKTVSVGAYPVAAITADAPLTFCSGDSVTLSVANNPGYLYEWRMGGTPVTGAESYSIKARQTGSFSVQVVNPLGNCTTLSGAVSVTARNAPASPTIIEGGPVSFCQGDSVMLSVTDDPELIYRWKLNGGDVGTNISEYKARTEGAYNLVVLNSTGCSSVSTNTIQVTVKSNPVLSTVSLSGPTTFCEGGELTMSVPFTMGYTYRWENEFGAITGAAGNSHQAFISGSYRLVIGSMEGCEVRTSPIQVTMKPNPVMPVIATENYESGQCLGDIPIVLRANPVITGYTYQWKRNGIIIPGATQGRYEGIREAGEYTVQADNQGCRAESGVQSVVLGLGPPKPALIAEGPVVWYLACSNDSAAQYRWYYDGQIISGADKHIYVANQELGTYMVAISTGQGCFTFSDPMTIPPDAIGIDDVDVFSTLKIFPNPTSGLFTIVMNNQLYGDVIVSVYTEEGRKVWNGRYDKITEYFSCGVDMGVNGSGVYFVNLRAGSKEVSRKVVVCF